MDAHVIDEHVIGTLKNRLNIILDYLLYNYMSAGAKLHIASLHIEDCNIDVGYIKCTIVNNQFHGIVHGNFPETGKSLQCTFEKGELLGPVVVSWTGAYIYTQMVTHTSTQMEGSFTQAGFTGKYIKNGRFAGEQHYINSKLSYECGKWICQDTALSIWDINTKHLGDAVIYYTAEGKIDYTRSLQKDDKGRDMCLPVGDIIVYKICKTMINGIKGYCYVKLSVPADVKRIPFIPFTTKSRVEKALVLEIFDREGNQYKHAYSALSARVFTYFVGEWAIPDSFDDNVTRSCSHGINIHMYMDHCDQWIWTR